MSCSFNFLRLVDVLWWLSIKTSPSASQGLKTNALMLLHVLLRGSNSTDRDVHYSVRTHKNEISSKFFLLTFQIKLFSSFGEFENKILMNNLKTGNLEDL